MRAGPQGDLPLRLAGRGRRQHRRADVPGPEPLPGEQRPDGGAAHQPGAAARRPDRARRGQGRAPLVRADHRRRRGRLRRPAQRLRADEGDDRGGRRGRALRGPARVSEKKCGHMGGKVLVPDAASSSARSIAARLAADVLGVPTLLVARTDADSAKLAHERRRRARPRRSSTEASAPRRASSGSRAASRRAIARGLAYAPYADLVWCETSTPDLAAGQAVRRGRSTRSSRASCSPTTARRRSTGRRTSTTRPSPSSSASSGAMGYKFQFVTLAGFHALNHGDVRARARLPATRGMAAYSELQQAEFAAEKRRLHRDPPPARGRHRLLRPGRRGHLRAARRRRSRSRTRPRPRSSPRRAGPARRTPQSRSRRRCTRTTGGSRPSSIGSRRRRTSPPSPAALEPLTQLLTEHFAHEEHQKGFYGLLSATSPEYRAQVAQMIQRAPAAPADAAGAPRAHEGPDDALGSRRAHRRARRPHPRPRGARDEAGAGAPVAPRRAPAPARRRGREPACPNFLRDNPRDGVTLCLVLEPSRPNEPSGPDVVVGVPAEPDRMAASEAALALESGLKEAFPGRPALAVVLTGEPNGAATPEAMLAPAEGGRPPRSTPAATPARRRRSPPCSRSRSPATRPRARSSRRCPGRATPGGSARCSSRCSPAATTSSSPPTRAAGSKACSSPGIVYPLTRALFGQRLRQPLGRELVLSRRLAEHILSDDGVAHGPVARGRGPVVRHEGARARVRIAQVFIGPRPRPAAAAAGRLRRARGRARTSCSTRCRSTRTTGSGCAAPRRSRRSARSTSRRSPPPRPRPRRSSTRSRWAGATSARSGAAVLPPQTLLALQRIPRDAARGVPHARRALGARALRLRGRLALQGAWTGGSSSARSRPIYMGWVASFVNEVGPLGPKEADERVERLCAAFEEEKPYLISRWRWPDRFNP